MPFVLATAPDPDLLRRRSNTGPPYSICAAAGWDQPFEEIARLGPDVNLSRAADLLSYLNEGEERAG